MRNFLHALYLSAVAPFSLAAQSGASPAPQHNAAMHAAHGAHADSAFGAMKTRGATVMGVDQDASEHLFQATATGGRIRFTMRDTADATGAATIRQHLRDVAAAFAKGDFRMPMAVHDTTVPGTETLQRERRSLRYRMRDVPGGGEVTITALTPAARRGVREFLAYQNRDHRTGAGH